MTENFKVNPLNVFDCREVKCPPPYFHYIYVDYNQLNFSMIKKWIYLNLKGRFYIGESLELENNQYVTKIKIGFEEPKESSFFIIACSLLKNS